MLEPILLPRLRIHFAEFPYLRCIYWPEASNLGDLLRFWYGRVYACPALHWGSSLLRRAHAQPHRTPCFVSQRSTASRPGGSRGLPAAVLHPPGHTASPRLHTARKSSSDSLSVACHCALRPRLTFCRAPAQKNPSPLRPSEFPSELLLLPPRSALQAPPHARTRMLLRYLHAPLLHAPRVRGLGAGLQRHPFSEQLDSAGTL